MVDGWVKEDEKEGGQEEEKENSRAQFYSEYVAYKYRMDKERRLCPTWTPSQQSVNSHLAKYDSVLFSKWWKSVCQ